jgi:hypothetical protein
MDEPDYRQELRDAVLKAATAQDTSLRRAYEDLAAFYRSKLKGLSESGSSRPT